MDKTKLYQTIENINQPVEEVREFKWAERDTLDVTNFRRLIHPDDFPLELSFELDTFQKRACYRIFTDSHVFVSAHTSAGKTVTAEWAISQSMKAGRKAIYTSPIKALSNQKFRDFLIKFSDIEVEETSNGYDSYDDYYDDYGDDGYGGGYGGGYSGGGYGGESNIYDFDTGKSDEANVGIITGDIQLNKDAPCLVLTTEILRSMIYDNDPILQDLEWVVFDEIHYMNDPERGRVWEEVIALLPSHVHMLFLSATTPNAMEFSEWVGRVRRQKVYVVSTDKRPIIEFIKLN